MSELQTTPSTWELTNRTTGECVTTNARLVDDVTERARGLMFKRDVPDDGAYIFHYGGDIGRRGIHMLFVFCPLDVVWLQRGRVTHTATLRPWWGREAAQADVFIEFPAGGADGISVGDKLAWGPR